MGKILSRNPGGSGDPRCPFLGAPMQAVCALSKRAQPPYGRAVAMLRYEEPGQIDYMIHQTFTVTSSISVFTF